MVASKCRQDYVERLQVTCLQIASSIVENPQFQHQSSVPASRNKKKLFCEITSKRIAPKERLDYNPAESWRRVESSKTVLQPKANSSLIASRISPHLTRLSSAMKPFSSKHANSSPNSRDVFDPTRNWCKCRKPARYSLLPFFPISPLRNDQFEIQRWKL